MIENKNDDRCQNKDYFTTVCSWTSAASAATAMNSSNLRSSSRADADSSFSVSCKTSRACSNFPFAGKHFINILTLLIAKKVEFKFYPGVPWSQYRRPPCCHRGGAWGPFVRNVCPVRETEVIYTGLHHHPHPHRRNWEALCSPPPRAGLAESPAGLWLPTTKRQICEGKDKLDCIVFCFKVNAKGSYCESLKALRTSLSR